MSLEKCEGECERCENYFKHLRYCKKQNCFIDIWERDVRRI